MRTQISKLNLKYEKMKEQLDSYKQSCATPTFRGFMLSIGLTKRHLIMMNDVIKSCDDDYKHLSKYYKIMQLLEDYKDELETKMEEYLIYQDKHPEMVDRPNYNFKNLEFVLKASNPQRYSSKTYLESNKESKKENLKIGTNISSIKFNDTD